MLKQIINHQIQHLNDLKSQHDIQKILFDIENNMGIKPRCFYQALKKDRHSYIFECKQQSPSKGIINKKYNIPELLNHYNPFASAISVLTNSQYFGGCFNDLQLAHQNTHLPILCKDFILDPLQIALAKQHDSTALFQRCTVVVDPRAPRLRR